MSANRPFLQAPHAVAAEVVVRTLRTDANQGLTSAAADERQTLYGRNELAQAPQPFPTRLRSPFAVAVRGSRFEDAYHAYDTE